MLSDKHEDLESESLLRIESESLSRIIESLLRIDRDFNKLILSQEIIYLTTN